MSSSTFRVTVDSLEEAYVIRVSGEVDMSTAHQMRRQLDRARMRGRTALLDLADVEFMDSSGLHVLLDASDGVDRGAFFIVRPSPNVQRLIAITETTDRLPLVAPEGDAAALSLRAGGPAWRPARGAAAASSGTGG